LKNTKKLEDDKNLSLKNSIYPGLYSDIETLTTCLPYLDDYLDTYASSH